VPVKVPRAPFCSAIRLAAQAVAASHLNMEFQFSETHWEITFEPQNWITRDTSGRKVRKRQRAYYGTMAIIAAAGEIAVAKHKSEHQAPSQDEDEDELGGDELDGDELDGDELDGDDENEDAREPNEWEMEELEQDDEAEPELEELEPSAIALTAAAIVDDNWDVVKSTALVLRTMWENQWLVNARARPAPTRRCESIPWPY